MRLVLPGSPQQLAPVPVRGDLAAAADASGAWSGGVDRRHTRRVAVLKRVLPAVGVGLLLLVAVWPRLEPLWERMRLGFPAIDLRDASELRMINPRYTGTDREGRPFVVTAAAGRQIPDRQDLMSLQAPRAEIKTQGGTEITVSAISAIYQAQANLLDLFGDVTVTHQNGTRFVTQSARVNAAQNTAEGGDPVVGRGPAGEVKAQGFRILDKGETVVFTGATEMLLHGSERGTAASAPAALPPPIAAMAAQIEAEAKPVLAGTTEAKPVRPAAKTAGKRDRRSARTGGRSTKKKR